MCNAYSDGESGYSAQILNAAASGAAGRAAAQARAVLGNSGGRTAVAADYLALVTRFAERTGEVLRAAPTASRRQSGRVGRNAASGRHVGQVCANGAATTLHPQFSWVGRVEEGRLAGTYRQPTVSIWSAAVSVVGASCCEILAG